MDAIFLALDTEPCLLLVGTHCGNMRGEEGNILKGRDQVAVSGQTKLLLIQEENIHIEYDCKFF